MMLRCYMASSVIALFLLHDCLLHAGGKCHSMRACIEMREHAHLAQGSKPEAEYTRVRASGGKAPRAGPWGANRGPRPSAAYDQKEKRRAHRRTAAFTTVRPRRNGRRPGWRRRAESGPLSRSALHPPGGSWARSAELAGQAPDAPSPERRRRRPTCQAG